MITKMEYASYFEPYIKSLLANGKTIVENLIHAQNQFEEVLTTISDEKQQYVYQTGKWTIKEIIQHLIDTERVFNYRALCFARNEKTPLPSFDQDIFVKYAQANKRNYEGLLNEMKVVRKSTIQLFNSFSEDEEKRRGLASGKEMSVRAAGYIISGHQKHHLTIIKERYL